MTEREWRLPTTDPAEARKLANAIRVPVLIAEWLLTRGYNTSKAAIEFLEAGRRAYSDPLALTDMDRAVERIQRARDANETIQVFGDYDVDGMSAMAILGGAFDALGIPHTLAMPDRLEEGYGLSPEHVDSAKQAGVSLIITVDNGIAAHDAARRASEISMDLIITDHHEIEGELPPALAIINPKRDPQDAPSAKLCGAGIAWKLAAALLGTPPPPDLAALATVADAVPLLDENRTLVTRGLDAIKHDPPLGIRALARRARFDLATITAEDIAFQIAPRLNAASRLGHADTTLRLLTCKDEEEANVLAESLEQANRERRQIEKDLLENVLDAIGTEPKEPAIVAAGKDWHSGVVGIVAAKIATRFQRPAVLIALNGDGLGRASARSPRGYHLAQAFAECAECLVQQGGHALAAGLTIEEPRVDEFRERFMAAIQNTRDDTLSDALDIDAILDLREIDAALLARLSILEPHGHGNPPPVFATFGATVQPETLRWLDGGHLKCDIQHNGVSIPAIGFGMADRIAPKILEKKIDVAYRPTLNTWRGETHIQLSLAAIRRSQRP